MIPDWNKEGEKVMISKTLKSIIKIKNENVIKMPISPKTTWKIYNIIYEQHMFHF